MSQRILFSIPTVWEWHPQMVTTQNYTVKPFNPDFCETPISPNFIRNLIPTPTIVLLRNPASVSQTDLTQHILYIQAPF